jgi:hypothetical protein
MVHARILIKFTLSLATTFLVTGRYFISHQIQRFIFDTKLFLIDTNKKL